MTPAARTHQRDRRRFPRLLNAVFAAAGAFALSLAIAACGGSSTPGAARDPSATAASNSSTGGGAQARGLLAYSACMRSHGVPNFPDPASSGGIPKETNRQLRVSQSQLAAASSACQHLIPPGESLGGKDVQKITTGEEQDYLKAAACMRAHGITALPEPVFQDGQVVFPRLEHLVDINSPKFKQALKVCQKLIPPGLPDSGS